VTPAPLDKSPDAFRTISEVADDLDVPQHVLRFWETRFTQIKPLKRGGGRRYYRPDDVDLLRGLKRLLYGEGYTIKGVQRILKERGPRHVIAIARGAPVEPETGGSTRPASGLEPERSAAPRAAAMEDAAPVDAGPGRSVPANTAPLAADAASALKAALFELSEARQRLLGITRPGAPSEDAA
jgi:DNA-binding transcriptional MerR regulator